MSVREDIKVLLAKENCTLTEMAREMTQRTSKSYSRPNLSQKLAKRSLRYEEAKLIGDILGYDLVFVKRKN